LYSLLPLHQKGEHTLQTAQPISSLRILQTLKTFINHPALLKKGRFVREGIRLLVKSSVRLTASSYMTSVTTYWRISSYTAFECPCLCVTFLPIPSNFLTPTVYEE
jgi:hypothetical protein